MWTQTPLSSFFLKNKKTYDNNGQNGLLFQSEMEDNVILGVTPKLYDNYEVLRLPFPLAIITARRLISLTHL